MRFFSVCLNLETQLTSNYGVACRRRLRGHRPWSSAHENGPANTASCGLPLESHTQTAVSQGPLACPSPNQHLLQQQIPINSAPCLGRRRSLCRRVCAQVSGSPDGGFSTSPPSSELAALIHFSECDSWRIPKH